MKRFPQNLIFSVILAQFATSAYAQEREVNFQEPFSDDGDSTAKALAQYANISLADAKARLVQQTQDSATAYAANSDFRDTAAGGDIQPVSGKLRIYVKRGHGATMKRAFLTRSTLSIARLGQRFTESNIPEIVEVEHSSAEMDAESDRILNLMDKLGISGSVSPNAIDNTITINVPNTVKAESLLGNSSITSFTKLSVKYMEPIKKTLITWSGGAYYKNSANMGCTTGFPARVYTSTTAYIKGFLIAAHCGSSGGLIDAYNNPYNNPSSISARTTQYASSSNDFQFVRFNDQNNNQLKNAFYDGLNNNGVTIDGAMYPGWNAFVCKYGKVTGRTCGNVNFTTFRDSSGTYFKVSSPTSSGSNPLARSGDSGGPVYSGNLIAGIVYGVDPSGSMYFSPLYVLPRYLPQVKLFCKC